MRLLLGFITTALFVVGCGDRPPDSDLSAERELQFISDSLASPTLVAPGPGAGEWNSETPSYKNKVLKKAALSYLGTGEARLRYGIEAVETLNHYFKKNGQDYPLNVATLVNDVESVRALLELNLSALEQWSLALPEGSTTFTSARALTSSVTGTENENWYLAVAGYSYWLSGKIMRLRSGKDIVTKIDAYFHVWDRYDWDPGVKVPINTPLGIVEIDQDKLGEFHRQGLAKEYNSVGSMNVRARF